MAPLFLPKYWRRGERVNRIMLANWGYQDGSGKYFITIDTEKCNGCGKCVEACPQNVLEVGEDPTDPLRDEPVAFVTEEQRRKLRFTCSPCKTYLTAQRGSESTRPDPDVLARELKNLPCIAACERDAITHSW